jgi:Secretion system C-terminal sorting domain
MRTIITLLFSLGCSFFLPNNSFAQNWAWARTSFDNTGDYATSSATDAFGNVYVAGYYHGLSVTFGSTTLNCGGLNSMYLVKYDPNGNLLWARGASDTDGFNQANGVAVDKDNNVYVVGFYATSTITFGTTTLTNTNSGTEDIFIVKYDGTGNVLWAKNEGGTGNERATSIAPDASGNMFVTGYYGSAIITFGTTTFALYTPSQDNMFLTKYTPNGNVIWAKTSTPTPLVTIDQSNAVATDRFGNVFVTGWFNCPILIFDGDTITNTGSYNAFLVKYDANGNIKWARSGGGTGFDYAYSVSPDQAGNVYIAGYTSQSTIAYFGTVTVANSGDDNAFLIKYDSTGEALWAKYPGGEYLSHGLVVKTDSFNNVYFVGEFYNSSLGSTITFDTCSLTGCSDSYSDIFLVRYNSSGNLIFAKRFGGIFEDWPTSISIDRSGDLFLSGTFSSPTLTFGTHTLTTDTLYQMFVAKMVSPVGIPQVQSVHKFSIFPNPASNEFTIHCDNLFPVGSIVELYDLAGKLINAYQFHCNELVIPVSDLAAGVYQYRIITGDGNAVVKKIVVIK